MRIDAYSHILPPRYFARMREVVTDPRALKRWLELPALHDVEARLRMMEEFGPDYQQILTLSSPPIELLATGTEAVELAQLANDSMRDLVVEHPERFPGFVAALPMADPPYALRELRRAIDELGAIGIQVFTNVNGVPLDDPAFEPVFAEMARRGLPVWMHPTRSAQTADYASEETSKYEIWWAFGWPYETSAAMARLVFSGILERYPELMVITHHMGAMIPYLEGRIRLGWSDQFGSRTHGSQAQEVLDQLSKEPVEYFRSFYADTALSGSAIGARCGLEFFGVDKVLFASDCPFDPEGGPTYIREMMKVIEALDVSPEEREMIFSGNLRRITGGLIPELTDRATASIESG